MEEFCASEKQISWWAVIGSGGSGKSRLAYQFIFRNIQSVEWKMMFLPEEFFKQEGGGGKYQTWNQWIYDKNLLLVIDYVQKYAKEVAQWLTTLCSNSSISRRIRILLLERSGEENTIWYKEIFDTPLIKSLQYKKEFLNLNSLEEGLLLFADEYGKWNQLRISTLDAEDALKKLKEIDTDARILYYIMILEAIRHGESWRNWSQAQLAEYIVKREIKFIEDRFKNKNKLISCYCRLLAFCTATKSLPFFDLPDNIPENIKSDINFLCDSMQTTDYYLKMV